MTHHFPRYIPSANTTKRQTFARFKEKRPAGLEDLFRVLGFPLPSNRLDLHAIHIDASEIHGCCPAPASSHAGIHNLAYASASGLPAEQLLYLCGARQVRTFMVIKEILSTTQFHL